MTDPTIQSPAGPAPDATGGVAVSLAEIDAMGRKAARGAGYGWGHAEEAGRAARWLATHGLAGPEQLAGLLSAVDARVAAHAPLVGRTPWTAPGGTLCPVQVGAALSDLAEELVAGVICSTDRTTYPLIVVPFLCWAARDLDFCIGLTIGDDVVVATPRGPAWKTLPGHEPATLTVSRRDRCDVTPVSPRAEARVVPVECWRTLDGFAARTYVPATAASRESGAGAGAAEDD